MSMSMNNLYSFLVTFSNALFKVQKIVLLVAVFIVVTVNFANVCLRYMASYSLNYCEMLSVVLFMFMVLIGANIAVKTDGEIKIEIFRFKSLVLDARWKLLGDLISVITVVLCCYGLYKTIGAVTRNPQRLTPLPLYTYHIYYVMTVGFILVLIDHLVLLMRHLIVALGAQLPEKEVSTL
ncbi:MAG TPA: hypothetical protein DCR21_01090 [Succinivibrionaceae bacterium]|nr:hypothetical protein [Succinivibrionaceae bacterium]